MMISITALRSIRITAKHRSVLLTGEPAVLADEVARALLAVWALPVIDVDDLRVARQETFLPVCLRVDPADKLDPKELSGLLGGGQENRILVVQRATSKPPKGFEPDVVIECGPLRPEGPRFRAYLEWCVEQAGASIDEAGLDVLRVKLGQPSAQGRCRVEIAKLAVRLGVVVPFTAATVSSMEAFAEADADALVEAVLQGDRRTALLLATSWLDRTDVLTAAVGILTSRIRLARAWMLASDRRQSKRDFCTRFKLPAFRFGQVEAALPAVRHRFDRIVAGLCTIDQAVRTRSDEPYRFDAVLRGVLEMT